MSQMPKKNGYLYLTNGQIDRLQDGYTVKVWRHGKPIKLKTVGKRFGRPKTKLSLWERFTRAWEATA